MQATRKETIGDAELWFGNSLVIMAAMQPDFAARIHLTLTDAPYLLTSGGCTEGGLHERFGKGESKYGNTGEIVPCDTDWPEFMPLIYACMERGHAYFMANNRHLANCENAALAAGFRFHNWLVWDKRTATPNRWYMKNCEFTGLFYKGKASPIIDCGSKQLISCPQVDETTHPTEKPVPLMEHYINNSSQRGQTVFDPFMGSGTTGVAALNLDRKFIGIERDEKYFNMACRRMELAVRHQQKVLI